MHSSKKPLKGVRISSAAHTRNSLSERVSLFLIKTSANTVPRKNVHFKPARLVKGKKSWYAEFKYRVPEELKEKYKGRIWERFRMKDNINGAEERDAIWEVEKINEALEMGYNPFEDELKAIREKTGKVHHTVKTALEYYLSENDKKNLEPDTITRYRSVCYMIQEWCVMRGLTDPSVLTRDHIKDVLNYNREKKGWGPRQYNNMKDYMGTVFNFLQDESIVAKSPVEGVKKLKAPSKKHRYYDKDLFPKMMQVMRENDRYLSYMAEFVYYLCVRSDKELRAMKVGDIVDRGEYFRFRDDATKGDREDLIPIDPNLRELMETMNLFKSNASYYIFSKHKSPSPEPLGANWIGKHFAKIRKLAGLTSLHTLYGFKHTRTVHLLKAGAKLADVSILLRHRDIATTAKYARDLGVDFDPKELQRLTQKI